MNILYFRSEKGHYHELLETTPARGAEQKLEYLRDQPFFNTIEVYIDSTWVKGERVAAPKEHLVTVSVVAFASDDDIRRAISGAIGKARQEEENRDTLTWFKLLTPKEADALHDAFSKLKGQADRALGDYEEQGEWVGGDSWDDFLSHIIGMGKQEYEADLKDKDRALARFRKGDYRESFAYALPTSQTYERLDLGKYVKWAQKEADAYREILGASDDDIPWKNKLAPDLKKLVDILDDFIRTKDFGAFLDKEDEAKRAAQDVEQVLRRLSGSGLDGSLGEAVDFARNKWGVWNLFTDVRQYLG